ncbi:hypothetical protein COO60DRAFT_1645593, partial [Scenedesmus sp. NREL 46B-D3]
MKRRSAPLALLIVAAASCISRAAASQRSSTAAQQGCGGLGQQCCPRCPPGTPAAECDVMECTGGRRCYQFGSKDGPIPDGTRRFPQLCLDSPLVSDAPAAAGQQAAGQQAAGQQQQASRQQQQASSSRPAAAGQRAAAAGQQAAEAAGQRAAATGQQAAEAAGQQAAEAAGQRAAGEQQKCGQAGQPCCYSSDATAEAERCRPGLTCIVEAVGYADSAMFRRLAANASLVRSTAVMGAC